MNDKYKMLKLKVDQVTDENKQLKMRLEESNEQSVIFQKQFYEEIEKLKEKVNNYSKENLNRKMEFTKFEKDKFEETSALKNELILWTNTIQNIKDEYIWINNSWEQIGSTAIDLTGYATESWVNTQIANFLTQSQIETLITSSLVGYARNGDIPTKTSDLTNDSGFIDNSVSNLTNYYNKTYIDTTVGNIESLLSEV